MARKRSQDKQKGRKLQVELSSGRLFLWGGGLLFLLVWIFALGILVGRGFLPGDRATEELKEQIGKLQEIMRRDRVRQVDREPDTLENPKLAFYEKLATKKDEALGRESAAQVKEERNPSPRQVQRPETAKRRLEEQPQSEPDQRPPPAPAADPPVEKQEDSPVQARFTVQVAATTTRSAAEDMIQRLKRKGHPAYYYDVDIKGTTYYRVRCGKFLSRTEAEQYAGLLKKKEGIKGFVSGLE